MDNEYSISIDYFTGRQLWDLKIQKVTEQINREFWNSGSVYVLTAYSIMTSYPPDWMVAPKGFRLRFGSLVTPDGEIKYSAEVFVERDK